MNQRKDLLNPTLYKIFQSFQLDKNYLSGEGSYLVDEKGISYLDFIAQFGAIPFGYNPDFIWDKLEEVRRKTLPSLVQPSLPGEALKLANALAAVSPGKLAYCTFCQSGTEAVEAAIKLARSTTGREIILSTFNSFHGKSLGSLSATGKISYQSPFRAPAPGFIYIPYDDIAALQAVLDEQSDRIAAFIVEPVQGEGGIIAPRPGYLKAAEQLCRQYGVLFIVDEIQTGLGRSGALFACEHEKVEPDIMLLAKALGGGIFPLGVCLSSEGVWNDDFGFLHSSTFANNNVSCAVGLAVLDKLLEDDRRLIKEVAAKGDYLLEKLQELAVKYPEVIKEVRGKGLMLALEFQDLDDCGSYDMSFMVDQGAFTTILAGFLLNVFKIRLAPYLNNSMTLRLEPSLNIGQEEMDYVLAALDKLCQILKYRDYALLYGYLLGDYSPPARITDYRAVSRAVKASPLSPEEKISHKFAFIIHYPAPEDVIANNPSFKAFERPDLYRFLEWQSSFREAGVCCHMPALRSHSGAVVEGWLIGVPFGAREMMNLPREETLGVIKKAVELGRELGAEIVGLGALSSVVSRGGRAVAGQGVAITSGNSFTTLMAMEALLAGARKMRINFSTARGAVLGATGSIGRACALLLSQDITNIVLLGNPRHPRSSRNRLNSLTIEMLALAYQRRCQGILSGLSEWLDRLINSYRKKDELRSLELEKALRRADGSSLELIKELCRDLAVEFPLEISMDLDASLPQCDMIVAASNSPEFVVYPRHLQSGAVICDVARPADVAPEVRERDDVLVLEGGLVSYPEPVAFGPNLGYRDGVNLGCLSETILLALEGDCRDFSIGSRLSLDTIEYLRRLGEKHGFALAGLMTGNREIGDKEIEEIYRKSLSFKQANNL